MNFKERYTPYPIGVNGTLTFGDSAVCQLGHFHAVTAGTITIVSQGTTLLNAFPVTAGQFLPIAWLLPGQGGATITLAGGASGTISV